MVYSHGWTLISYPTNSRGVSERGNSSLKKNTKWHNFYAFQCLIEYSIFCWSHISICITIARRASTYQVYCRSNTVHHELVLESIAYEYIPIMRSCIDLLQLQCCWCEWWSSTKCVNYHDGWSNTTFGLLGVTETLWWKHKQRYGERE